MSWANTFTYKGFSLYFLIDMRKGGDVMSLTQATLDGRGVTKATAEARDLSLIHIFPHHQSIENSAYRTERLPGFYSFLKIIAFFVRVVQGLSLIHI